MKAYSVGLEVFVDIRNSELGKIKEGGISGVLKFRDWFSVPEIRRNIPLRIRCDQMQAEDLVVEQRPKDAYMGNAEEIGFIISRRYYESLSSAGEYVCRFLHSGKLAMRVC